jgi:hypothetical protein
MDSIRKGSCKVQIGWQPLPRKPLPTPVPLTTVSNFARKWGKNKTMCEKNTNSRKTAGMGPKSTEGRDREKKQSRTKGRK